MIGDNSPSSKPHQLGKKTSRKSQKGRDVDSVVDRAVSGSNKNYKKKK